MENKNLNQIVDETKNCVESELFPVLQKIQNTIGYSPDNDTIIIGKNEEGECVTERLSKLQSILIGGGTGSGKSVFLNSIITSLIAHLSPQDLYLILIDSKAIEFNSYKGFPHLLTERPITELKDTLQWLDYAIDEMNERYSLLAKARVRNNKSELVQNGTLPKKPRMVIVIDEFADLMINFEKIFKD